MAVANKVQTLDGRWLSIDGRVLFKANVAASETYNTALEQHLRDTSRGAVRRTARHRPGEAADPGDRRCRPSTEPALVDPPRPHRDPPRRARHPVPADHGRPPTPVEALQLAQQATLETRDAKHEPRSLAEQRATWLAEAADVLGGPERRRSRWCETALTPPARPLRSPTPTGSTQTADQILAVMEESRSTWQMWHVRAEAQRQVRTIDVPARNCHGTGRPAGR